jgi:hypothetical protein
MSGVSEWREQGGGGREGGMKRRVEEETGTQCKV